jgi:hypothetical protein
MSLPLQLVFPDFRLLSFKLECLSLFAPRQSDVTWMDSSALAAPC